MSREAVEIITLIVMMFIITWSWYKNENSVWKSLLFTVLTCGIFYLNTPNFLSIVDGTQPRSAFFPSRLLYIINGARSTSFVLIFCSLLLAST